MASFRFTQLNTLTLIEELNRANMLAPDCADQEAHNRVVAWLAWQ